MKKYTLPRFIEGLTVNAGNGIITGGFGLVLSSLFVVGSLGWKGGQLVGAAGLALSVVALAFSIYLYRIRNQVAYRYEWATHDEL